MGFTVDNYDARVYDGQRGIELLLRTAGCMLQAKVHRHRTDQYEGGRNIEASHSVLLLQTKCLATVSTWWFCCSQPSASLEPRTH